MTCHCFDVHVHKMYKTRVGDRQRKSEYCGIYVKAAAILVKQVKGKQRHMVFEKETEIEN